MNPLATNHLAETVEGDKRSGRSPDGCSVGCLGWFLTVLALFILAELAVTKGVGCGS